MSLAFAMLLLTGTAEASRFVGSLVAGIRTGDPRTVVEGLAAGPRIGEQERLVISWTVPLEGGTPTDAPAAVRELGATPWVRVVFETPAPLIAHLDELERELVGLVGIVRSVGVDTVIQTAWLPREGELTPGDLAYLVKRAAVVITGAAPEVEVAVGPLPADPPMLEWLYVEEVAAYIDILVLAPGPGTKAAIEELAVLDPGKPIAIDAVPAAEPLTAVAEVAGWAAAGATITLIQLETSGDRDITPFVVAAHELAGALVHDPFSDPSGSSGARAFVREDLALRVIARSDPEDRRLRLVFADDTLRSPELVDLETGVVREVTGVRRDGEFVVVVNDPPPTVLLRLQRPSAAELEGFDEEIEIGGGREMPVEEIIRRLQAFEDAQDRRLRHYQAHRRFSLRYQGTQGSIDVAYSGEYFFADDSFDWVWSDLHISGVKWRSRKMPKIPLIQPEKVASQPIDIEFSKFYEYRLRGTDVVDERDCWVVDFKPTSAAAGDSLFQGTVWVDRETYARVRTRAVQVGLEGEVLSNEEIYHYRPLDENGQPAPWSAESFILPVRISGQQVFSILNATLPIEVDSQFTEIRINGDDFDSNREAALASDATMVRDTDQGLRYLKKEKSGERVVEEGFDSSRLFLVGGAFWDESLDYPVPGIGVNYLDFDFKDSGAQLNVFFAGLFLAANIADPDFLGSRWNAGASVNGLFFKAGDELYRDGMVVPQEEVERRSGNFGLFLGRPLGKFLSLETGYRGRYSAFDRADDTAEDFVLPQDTLTHVLEAKLDYNRGGYRISIAGDLNHRSEWDFWGLPGNTEYNPDQQDYARWQLKAAKTWWFDRFHKIALNLEYLDSADTDRFSGYDFGIFGDSTVGGYPSGLVRAEQVKGAHLNGGINIFEIIRVSVGIDAVWASNQRTGLDNELLAGLSAGGTVTLPWQLVMNFDVGYALAGPGKGGVAARVFFLKLFPGS
jgi:hypothetical protein